MESAKRCFGFFHAALAAAVAVQALASSSYDQDLSNDVWYVLNWLMAVAVITAVAFAYDGWRRAEAPAPGTWISPRMLSIASAVLLVLYFEQWSSEVDAEGLSVFRRSLWLLIDTLFVVVNATVGMRLLRHAK